MTVVVDPDLAPDSGTNLDDLVARVRRELSDREALNVLAESVDESATSLRFEHGLEGVTRGSILNIDNEIFYVWSADAGNKSAEVLRGYGTDVEPHGPGAIVSAGTFSRKQIIDAINDELSSLSGQGLYQMKSTLAQFNPVLNSVRVPSMAGSDIYEVQFQPWGFPTEWRRVRNSRFDAIDQTIYFDSSPPESMALRVLYKAPFNRFTDGGDDVQSTTGLHAEAADILVLGAAHRITVSDEFKRNNFRTQGDTRRADEVPYRALSLARRDFKELRDQRLMDERDRLRRAFPTIRPNY